MSDFLSIFEEALCIVTVQPREGRMRYELPLRERWTQEERMRSPERTRASMAGQRGPTTTDTL